MHFPTMIDRDNRRNVSPEPSSSTVNLCVEGRHALLFDDDASAAFTNSVDALLPWSANPSLLLDRYDVRHLLSSLPPRPKTRRTPPPPEPDGVSESDLDRERYKDIPNEDEDGIDAGALRDSSKSGTYGAVFFSYGNDHDASKNCGVAEHNLASSGYHPPFPVPENLLASLPPSEKLHEIISRTVLFVRKHGGQSEFILRVKQGDNPTFGFLMPDHTLHPYFRFLVDHPELLVRDDDNPRGNTNKVDNEASGCLAAGGALSLLGSVYGNEEEEDKSQKAPSDFITTEPAHIVPSISSTRSDVPAVQVHSTQTRKQDESVTTENANSVTPEVKSSCVAAFTSDANANKLATDVSKPVVTSMNKHHTSTSSSVLEDKATSPIVLPDNLPILEPPNFLKTAVDKIVEFIVRNGKQFEAVLVAQDKPHGRFPFLLKSNPFHPYYLKVLQEAQESKTSEKDSKSRKHDSERRSSSIKRSKEAARSKDSDGSLTGNSRSIGRESSVTSQPSAASDLEKKEKFNMVLSGPKKETHDQASKPLQHQDGEVSVDTVAQIVLAATRGLGNQKLHMMENVSQVATRVAHSSKAIGSFSVSSHGHNSLSKPNLNLDPGKVLPNEHATARIAGGNDVSVAKVMAKTTAVDASNEADSSEACLPGEEKRKAERLRRAKMFAAMLKSGSSHVGGSLPHLSGRVSNSGISDLLDSSGKVPMSNLADAERVDTIYRELDGSIVLVDAEPLSVRETDKKDSVKESKEKHVQKHHSKSRRYDEESDDHKPSKKKHRSNCSSRYSDVDEDSEEEGKLTQAKHRSLSQNNDGEDSDDDKRSKKRHRHHGSSRCGEEDEHNMIHVSSRDKKSKSRHKSRHQNHSEHGHRHGHKSRSESTTRPKNHSSRYHTKIDKEDGEVRPDDFGESPSRVVSNTAEIPDELRQKVRAMLLANM